MTASPLRLSRRAFLIASAVLASAPRLGFAQTPAPASSIDFASRLGALLGAAPAQELTASAPIPFYYADLAGQLDSLGIERPRADAPATDLPAGFGEGIVALPLAARAYQSGLVPEWFDTFGFSPLAVGQALEIATAPDTVSIFAGGYEREIVESALEASGYQPVLQESGGMYWSFDELDLTSPVGRLGVGAMNQAVVDDDLLIFTAEEAVIQQITQVRAGFEPSMLEQGPWAGMVSVFSQDLVGMVPLLPGVLLRGSEVVPPSATPVGGQQDTGTIKYLAFGVRAGSRSAPLSLVGEGTPEATPVSEVEPMPARVEVRIRYSEPTLAEREVKEIPTRWESASSMLTGQPYADLMTLEDARVSEKDELVAAIDFTASMPNVWMRMIHTMDLLPFLPTEG